MKNLLLIEEDIEGREVLARILTARGFRVMKATNESAALTVIGSVIPVDVVIAGATTRDRSDFLADLRRERPHVPVVFLMNAGRAGSASPLSSGPFSLSRKLNFYVNRRSVGIDELDWLIRIIILNRHGVVPLYRAAAA